MKYIHWKWLLLLASTASLTAVAALPEPYPGSKKNSCYAECATKLEKNAGAFDSTTCMTTCEAERALNRPRPEDYSSYSLYLQALFAYQRIHQTSAFPEPSTLQNDNGQPTPPESLDDAIARAAQGDNPHYVDTSGRRSTFKSFGLAQVGSQDLSSTGVDGVLGIFGAHNLQKASGPRIAGLPEEDGTFRFFSDIDRDNMFFDYAARQPTLNEQILIFNTTVHLGEGWAYVDGSSTVNPDGSMSLTLNSNVQTSAYIVDRDGLPGVYPGAGAVIIDPLRIQLTGLHANISAQNNLYPDPGFLITDIYTNNSIRANLSGTKIAVAEATKGAPDFTHMTREKLGPPTTIMEFGSQSELVIAPGTMIHSVLERADGRNRPLSTASGRINGITLTDYSLIDNPNNGRIHIAKFSLTDMLLKSMKVYVIGDKIEVEQEAQIKEIAVHDLSAGSRNGGAPSIADFYIDNVQMRSKARFESH
jgi:hypothetical protein